VLASFFHRLVQLRTSDGEAFGGKEGKGPHNFQRRSR
jgi:hypothetical protein